MIEEDISADVSSTEDPSAEKPEDSRTMAPLTHEQISERRAKELVGLLDIHKVAVAQAQKDYPVPIGVKFQDMDLPAQLRHGQRAEVIKKSAQTYNVAVRAACAWHRAEDDRPSAEQNAMESV